MATRNTRRHTQLMIHGNSSSRRTPHGLSIFLCPHSPAPQLPVAGRAGQCSRHILLLILLLFVISMPQGGTLWSDWSTKVMGWFARRWHGQESVLMCSAGFMFAGPKCHLQVALWRTASFLFFAFLHYRVVFACFHVQLDYPFSFDPIYCSLLR